VRPWVSARALARGRVGTLTKEVTVSVAKVVEIFCESPKSFEDAIQVGIKRAGKTIKNIRGAWINEQKMDIEKGKVVRFRVSMKVTFVLSE
jgi:flavin-binding protein dodecin